MFSIGDTTIGKNKNVIQTHIKINIIHYNVPT